MVKTLLGLALWILLVFSSYAATPARKLPSWQELSPQQQSILAPLAGKWNTFNARRKRTLLDVANRYPGMSPNDQLKVERRIQRWVKLTQKEHGMIRERAKTMKRLPPKKKQQLIREWNLYSELPEEERKKLRTRKKRAQDSPRSPAGNSPNHDVGEELSPTRP